VYLLISSLGKFIKRRKLKKSFENVAKFKYLGMMLDQNWTHKEIKSRLNLEVLATMQFRIFCPLTKEVNIKIHKILILTDVLYGCETWSLTLR
jgi:hypothetical protein